MHAKEASHGSSHGSAGGHGHSEGHHTLALEEFEDVALFAGGLMFFAFLYLMTSRKFVKRHTHAKTWEWVSTTLSIFIAVCVWASYNFLVLLQEKADMKKAGDSATTIAFNLSIYALFAVLIFMTIYLIAVSCLPHFLTSYVPETIAFVTVWAHVVGFAMMNHIAYTQDYFVSLFSDSDSPGSWVFCIAVLVWLAYVVLVNVSLHIVLRVILASCVTHDSIVGDELEEKEGDHIHEQSPYEVVHHHLEEFSVEVGGLALSYTMLRAICGGITGTLPEVFQVTGNEMTSFQIGLLSAFAILFAILAAIMLALEEDCTGKHHGFEFSSTFMTFLTAFTFLQAIRWSSYTKDPSTQHSLYHHIVVSLVCSYIGLTFNLIWYEGCSHKLMNFVLEVSKIFGILAAFSWELSLDIMLEQANLLSMGDSLFANYVDAGFILVLLAFLTPLFIFGVYPTTHVCKKENRRLLALKVEGDDDESASEDEEALMNEQSVLAQ